MSQLNGFCDCCTSTLIFKDDNRYIYNSFCQGSEYITSGKYKLDEDFLHLISDTICMMYEYNWENEVDTSAVDFILNSRAIENQKIQLQRKKWLAKKNAKKLRKFEAFQKRSFYIWKEAKEQEDLRLQSLKVKQHNNYDFKGMAIFVAMFFTFVYIFA